MDQGFAPTDGLKAARRAHVPANQSPVSASHNVLRAPKAITREDKAIATAQNVSSIFNLPLFAGFMASIPMGMAGWVAKKTGHQRSEAWLGGLSAGMAHQPRTTTMANAFELPADMAQRIADKAGEVGGRASGMAATMQVRSDTWRQNAGVLKEQLGRITAPVRSVVGNALEKVNLKAPVKSLLGRAGKLPVGAGMATIAAAGGITAAWLMRNKESKEHVRAQSDIRAMFGNDSPIAVEAAKVYSKAQRNGIISAALESANQVLMIGFEMFPSAGAGIFVPMMAGQMGLSTAQQVFVTENPTADAFTGLKKVQAGEIQAPLAQKAFWFQVMLGDLPEVKAKGGARNHLAAAMGKELAEKGTTVEQFAALVKDHAQFTTLASSVSEKMEAAKAAQAAAAKAAPAQPAHPTLHAAAPAAKVTSVAHEGQLHSQQLASGRH